jgi:pimeloyl-ACP methyl ester carboxylesterase
MSPSAGERFADVGRGIRLCFERIGDSGASPLLLIAGLGQQLHAWPTALCERLADRGFAVYRFDNRDAGRSTHLTVKPPGPLAMLTGRIHPRHYHLGDLARDAVGLLDALGQERAHLAGMSMGGMIAQTMAAHFPSRALSLASIMSMTGARHAGRPALSTWPILLRPAASSREAAVREAVRAYRHIGSHGFPFDETWVRAEAARSWDRDPSPGDGTARQLAAIVRSGDRTRELAGIRVPTVVIHGDRDLMVHASGALATKRAIEDAELATITGMGHDLPAAAWPRIVDLVHANAHRADELPTPMPAPGPGSRRSHDQKSA